MSVSIPFGLIWCFLQLLTCCSTNSTVDDIEEKSQRRIVGGNSCPIENYPFMISIRYTLSRWHHCGGTLLSEFWILTAAHCTIFHYIPATFTAVAGSSYIDDRDEFNSKMQTALIIENYKHTLPEDNDIGLMKLNYPLMESSHVQYVKLPYKSLTYHKPIEQVCRKAVVLGWGEQFAKNFQGDAVETSTTLYNPHLQFVELNVISNKECSNRYKQTISENFMCTFLLGKDACQGDSGGPLLCNGIQYGIVSSGEGCASTRYAGIYARVDIYEDFIQDIIYKGHETASSFKSTKLPFFFTLVVIFFSGH